MVFFGFRFYKFKVKVQHMVLVAGDNKEILSFIYDLFKSLQNGVQIQEASFVYNHHRNLSSVCV